MDRFFGLVVDSMIDVSYICEVIFVAMGKFKFPKSS